MASIPLQGDATTPAAPLDTGVRPLVDATGKLVDVIQVTTDQRLIRTTSLTNLTELAELSHTDVMLGADRAWQGLARSTPLISVPRRVSDTAVHIAAEIPALIARAMKQSFVPVVDDREVFIGIVRRRPIIEYCTRLAALCGLCSDLPVLMNC